MTELATKTLFPFKRFAETSSFEEGVVNTFAFDKFNFSIENRKQISCEAKNNKFTYCLKRNKLAEPNKPIVIICSKNNANILEFTLNKLKNCGTLDKYDILLVDDRSDTSEILSISEVYNTSYLRIDNSQNAFNYSIINNIAASYANFYNKKLLVFHNNDLWPENKDSLDNLIKKHIDYNSNISGCKLIYPSEKEYEQIGKPVHTLGSTINKIYGSIQHGGVFFVPRISAFTDNNRRYLSPELVLAPLHSWRFYSANTIMASKDSVSQSVTGAIHIVSTQDFISLGGLNTAMGTSYQDIDLCLKAIKNNMVVNYIGSETMIHAESITHSKENIIKTNDHLSDSILWDIIWGIELPQTIGQEKQVI